jgi:two-component system, NtrC family, response regulator AtoC
MDESVTRNEYATRRHMSIAIFAYHPFPIDDVAGILRRDGVDAYSVGFHVGSPCADSSLPTRKAVLIEREQGCVSVGERITLLREAIGPEIPIVLCTPLVTLADRRTLVGCGASEVISPIDWHPANVAERILGEIILEGDVEPSSFGTLRGATLPMRDLYSHIEKLAPLAEPILILGETGTGKELVAREIHGRSGRTDKFLAINCAELNPELLGSELFGHERGAFTNAAQARRGLLSEAGNGTVFLDEIGDLDLGAQAKLLRVIENRELRPVGSNKWQELSARIVLATNCDLEESCAVRKFRRDLYERIRGFTLELPPLRSRKADIPLLARYFADEYSRSYPGERTFPPGALDPLFRYTWPGNVRELRSVVRKAATYADNAGRVSTVILQEAVRNREPKRPTHTLAFDPKIDNWRDLIKRVQEQYLRAVLEHTGWDKEAAARLAGMGHTQFYQKLKDFNITTDSNPEDPSL